MGKSKKPHAETEKDPRFNGIASSLRSLSSSQFALPKAFQTIRFANVEGFEGITQICEFD
jgi:hypothetical protein